VGKYTYDESQALQDFFTVLATDEKFDLEFIVAVEGNHYPVTGVMFHPET
jgi:anthranilate/para-aminobenzoate synthase component II